MVEIEGWQTLDDNGIQMPWYTRPCLKWLKTLDLKGKKIFEYGVGHSTKWYKYRGALTCGVDSNKEWADLAGCDYINCDSDGGQSAYITSIEQHGDFEIICIDGIFRDECTELALRHIKRGGFIIIDNYKQPSVQEHWPITEVLITGMNTVLYKEPKHYDWQTLVIHL